MEGQLLHRCGALPLNKELSSRSSVRSFKFLISVSLDVRRKTQNQQLLTQTGPLFALRMIIVPIETVHGCAPRHPAFLHQ